MSSCIFHLIILLLIKGIISTVLRESRNLEPHFLYTETNVRFLLYTRCNKKAEMLVLGNFSSVATSNFDAYKKTKILIHGWLNSGTSYFGENLKNAYLAVHDYNIIIVDWSWYSYNFYAFARFSIGYIGPFVGKMLAFLEDVSGMKPDKVHILGHSLGAHIAGLAGKQLQDKVSRITGMDPASPLIWGSDNYRLDSNDAEFVDVIHTTIHYLGVGKPIGHVDFYPNGGGPFQPGCGLEIIGCAHGRSYLFYIESISDEMGFIAKKCESWAEYVYNNCTLEIAFMGELANPTTRGKYFLRTANSSPFALGNTTNDNNL